MQMQWEGAVIAVEHAGDGSLVVIESGKIRRRLRLLACLLGLRISLLDAHSEPFMFNNVTSATSPLKL